MGTFLDFPPLKSWSFLGAQNEASQECVHAARRALYAQQGANVEENVMGGKCKTTIAISHLHDHGKPFQ